MRYLFFAVGLAATSWGTAQDIKGYEYWFNQDDAPGQRTFVAVSNSPFVSLTENIQAGTLPVGRHSVRYRVQDTNGRWSGVISKPFIVQPSGPFELVLLRYWSDPAAQSPSDLTEVPIDPSVQYLDIVDSVLFCNWSQTGAPTSVYFQLKDDHGQWSSVITRQINVDLVIGPPGMPGIIVGNSSPPDIVPLTYSVASVPGASYYVWNLPNGWSGTSSSNTIDVITGTSGDDGFITVAAVNGCGSGPGQSIEVHVSPDGIALFSEVSGFSVYPNPFSKSITVQPVDAKPMRVILYDALGKMIFDHVITSRTDIDLSGQAPGAYTAFFWKDQERIYRVTLVKQ